MDKVLIIDDEAGIRALLARILSLEGYEVVQAGSCSSGLKSARKEKPDIVLCDVCLPDGNGIQLIPELKAVVPGGEIIMLTAHGNIADGVQAIKNGAFDYITKGDDNAKIIPVLSRASRHIGQQNPKPAKGFSPSGAEYTFDNILGTSPLILQAKTLGQKVAVTDVPVLLTGETGTGKEVFAHSIHQASLRSQGEFVAVNCSAFSKELLESEMFGHKAGAFTGATKDKKGLFELADKGTIFLDEIGEMALELQAKLLRCLESGEYIKVGATRATRADVRIIAATNRNLEEEISKGHFRADLYYRLSVFQISLPELKSRPQDIMPLMRSFISRFSPELCLPADLRIEDGVESVLTAYDWPGNIRELRNVVERSLIVCDGTELKCSDLPLQLQEYAREGNREGEMSGFQLSVMEKHHITKVLRHTGGNKTEAARLLKIGLTTLYRKIEEYGI